MLIGDTAYYRLTRSGLVRTDDFDSCVPSPSGPVDTDTVRVWWCRNGVSRVDIDAGSAVRTYAARRNVSVGALIEAAGR